MKSDPSPAANTPTFVSLACAILLASLGTSIATVALPNLATVFAAGVQQVQWVVLAYLLSLTAVIVVAGRLGDIYGNRRVLIGGVLLFTLASAGCALAPTLDWLIACRTVQGLGAAALMGLPMSMAKTLITKERLGASMGLLGAMSAIGTATGPSVGGFFIDAHGWRSVFILLTLCGIIMLMLAFVGIRKTPVFASSTARMDWAGSVWLSVTLLCFLLAATGTRTDIAAQPWVLLALSVAAVLMFIRTELTAASPLLPVALFRGRVVATSLWMNLLVGTIMMSTLLVGSLFLSFGIGLTDAQTGLVMSAGPIAAALSGIPAGKLTDRFGTNQVLLAGLALATAGLVGFAVLPRLIDVPGYVLATVLMTPGFQMFLAANNSAAMSGVAEEYKGALSGLLGLSRNLGLLMGASLLPLLFTSMLDNQRLDQNTTLTVSNAFSITFLILASLSLLTLLISMLSQSESKRFFR